MQVPLPGVPTFIAALLSSHKNEGADEISQLHLEFIRLAQEEGIQVLSMGADGAASEFVAQAKVVSAAPEFYTFSAPDLDLNIKIPLFNNQPVVLIQDPKHARKTSSNQLLSESSALAASGSESLILLYLLKVMAPLCI